MNSKEKIQLIQLFRSTCAAVVPDKLVQEALRVSDDVLTVADKSYRLSHNVSIAAIGKASLPMLKGAQTALGSHIRQAIASAPIGSVDACRQNDELSCLLPEVSQFVNVFEGALNNLPDEKAMCTAEKVKQMACSLDQRNSLSLSNSPCFVSCGGSALLSLPIEGLTLATKQSVVKRLANRGATIEQLNTVRQHLSVVKGGKLAQLAYPAGVVSLIFSDIVGSPLDLVASGPTVRPTATGQDALKILQSFDAADLLPDSVVSVLRSSQFQANQNFDHVQNILLADNVTAVQAAEREASKHGYSTIRLRTDIRGEAKEIGQVFADFLLRFLGNNSISSTQHRYKHLIEDMTFNLILPSSSDCLAEEEGIGLPLCFIGSGETTVKVSGSGRGGRNQEQVLSFLIRMAAASDSIVQQNLSFLFLSAGTDGQDGPTDAAGAVCDISDVNRLQMNGNLRTLARNCLDNNDSYRFFDEFGGRCLVRSGPTGTNLMDLQLLLLYCN